MRILHTADWHLGDRLGRIDRTHDLRKAIERIARQCQDAKVDTLLVVGDLFSELSRPDGLRETIRHWQDVFADFLGRGGTILAITGNHDNENFCQTLCHAMALAAPSVGELGQTVPAGRLYLAAEPTFLQLGDVQFVLMPYPTPTRYLVGEEGQRYVSSDEKQKLLIAAFESTLRNFRNHSRYANVPTVLCAHATVRGANIGSSLFRLRLEDDLQVSDADLAEQFAYVALGHIHKPQALGGHEHIRYSGSIEAMDLGEQNDAKGTVLIEVTDRGRVGDIVTLPLPSSKIYELELLNPLEDLQRLKVEYPEPSEDLVNIRIRYSRGRDPLEMILKDLDSIFPRWYARDWVEVNELTPSIVPIGPMRTQLFSETVRNYVESELAFHDDAERQELIRRLDELIEDVEKS